MDKDKFKEYVIKTRIKKKGKLTKKELNDVYNGVKAMESLGAFNGNWKPKPQPKSIKEILNGTKPSGT